MPSERVKGTGKQGLRRLLESRGQFFDSVTLFRYIHQNAVKAGLVDTARAYKYSSWGNDYLGMSDHQVCYKQTAVNRFGIDELSAWMEMPLSGEVDCIDKENSRIVADETIRQMILVKSRTKSLTEFRLHSKERQKDIVRDVMLKLDSDPLQLSRVSGLPYSIDYKADTLFVNCRNLRYDKVRFGNGYTKAKRIGNRSLLFVNRLISQRQ